MSPTTRSLLAAAALAGTVLAAHAALSAWMAGRDVAAALLSAGPHVPLPALAGALAFVACRLLAVLFLPGLILAAAARLALGWFMARQGLSEAAPLEH